MQIQFYVAILQKQYYNVDLFFQNLLFPSLINSLFQFF